MMIADGEIQESEIEMIRGIYNRITRSQVSPDDLMSEADTIKREATGLHSDLFQLSGSLNNIGKELVVKAALSIAAADGQFQEEERNLIVDIATRLGMTPAHIRGTLQSILSP
jgi:tellurite resistance protein